MDASNPEPEHSDSDSGESWTLIEDNLGFTEDNNTDVAEHSATIDRDAIEYNEKDEDTDGISIISDSEPEIISEHLIYEENQPGDEVRPAETNIPQLNPLASSQAPNSLDLSQESIKEPDDFLIDSSAKLRTYVHRRNKRLSTVLNIIVLGSMITAAGVAIGHMWGVKDDCTLQSSQSVNKILSNLYKLQEENAFLRSKLKELTLINNINVRKPESLKITNGHLRCKKVFEEPLNNKNVDKLTKCIDDNNSKNDDLENHLVEPKFETEFLNDLAKLKNVYKQNKSWLDEEVTKRLRHEEVITKKFRTKTKLGNNITKKNYIKNTFEPSLDSSESLENIENENNKGSEASTESLSERKISYADSLKSVKENNRPKRNIDQMEIENLKENIRRKKIKLVDDALLQRSQSEDDFKKDNRFRDPVKKLRKKKYDRYKLNKKQKRRNKYEQWEMKGGYMKDYETTPSSSSLENASNGINKNINNEEVRSNDELNIQNDHFKPEPSVNNLDSSKKNEADTKYVKSKKEKKHKDDKNRKLKESKDKEQSWYEKRVLVRSEARKKLEKELFDTIPLQNNAAWYFRRMQKREQCRVDSDNSTHKQSMKRSMNFKTKH